jgi:hypothetical protein
MYQASIPVFVRYLGILSAILTKGEAHAAAKKIDPSVFINARLAPDMFPLSRQVQIAADISKFGTGRLAGVETPSFEDKETTFAELQERIKKTLAFIQNIKAEQIDGSEEKTINLKAGGQDLTFKGQDYLLNFVLPNLFFHVTTTYDILRHNSVELGKRDYLGA